MRDAAAAPHAPRQTLASLIQRELVSTVNNLAEDGEDRPRSEVWRMLQDQVCRLAVKERVESALASLLVLLANGRSGSGSDINIDVEVLDHHAVTTRQGYSFQTAHLRLGCHVHPPKNKPPHVQVQLAFRYERLSFTDQNACDKTSPTVSYMIDIIDDDVQLAEKLLWIQVWPAQMSGPSPNGVVIEMDDDQELLDGSTGTGSLEEQGKGEEQANGSGSGDDDAISQDQGPQRKKLRTETVVPLPRQQSKDDVKQRSAGDAPLGGDSDGDGDDDADDDADDDDDGNAADRYRAGVDIDLLDKLRVKLCLSSLDDFDACRFLFKFPFYECEWDLQGMLFDAIFGDQDESEVGDDE